MPRIIGIRYRIEGLACYDYEKDIILYDKRLDKFPKLKKKILEHEIDHSECFGKKIDYIRILKKELVDYPKLYFNDDYYRLLKMKNPDNKRIFSTRESKRLTLIETLMAIYSFICSIILFPIYIYKKSICLSKFHS
jgi:hypothetical protein